MKVYLEFFCEVKRTVPELYESKEKVQNNTHDKIQDSTIKILLYC